jgi:hypothetical protein
MRVIISGRVTRQHLEDAELLAGITATCLLMNDERKPPELGLPVEVMPICKMHGEDTAIPQRNYSLAQAGDALICVGRNDHLVKLCEKYGLPVYQEV